MQNLSKYFSKTTRLQAVWEHGVCGMNPRLITISANEQGM